MLSPQVRECVNLYDITLLARGCVYRRSIRASCDIPSMTSDKHSEDDPLACHRCQAAMVRVVYGFPGGDMFKAAERGEIALGGCVVGDDQPRWRCMSCDPRRARPPSSAFSTVAEAWAARQGWKGPSIGP